MNRKKEILHFKEIKDFYRGIHYEHDPLYDDFDILTLEESLSRTDSWIPVNTREFYILFIMNKPKDSVVIFNDQSYEQLTRPLFFMGPEHLFGGKRGEGQTGYFVAFKPSLLYYRSKNPTMDYPFFDRRNENAYELSPGDSHELMAYFRLLYKDRSARKSAEFLLPALLEKALLIGSRYEATAQAFNTEAELLQKLNALIDANLCGDRRVESFSERLCMTPNHLNRRVKNLTGKTAKHYITDRVLLEAKNYLAHTEMSVSSIAFRLGFNDASYFGRVFKKYTALSPGDFRRRRKRPQTSPEGR